MSAVPDHLLEVVFGQLRVSDCAACCCVSQDLKALAQVHCRLCCALDPKFAVPEPRFFAKLQACIPFVVSAASSQPWNVDSSLREVGLLCAST